MALADEPIGRASDDRYTARMRRRKPRICGSSVICNRRRKTASAPVTSPSDG